MKTNVIKRLQDEAFSFAYAQFPDEDAYGRSADEKKFNLIRDTKFAELVLKELVSGLTVEGSDFYHNTANNYGCISVDHYVPGDPNNMCGEEEQGRFIQGGIEVRRGTGRYKLNDQFVAYLMKQHFGVEQ